MNEQETFLNRIGRLFKRNTRTNGELSLSSDSHESTNGGEHPSVIVETRGNMIRPWGRNNQAIAQLQESFQTLTGLMGSIKENMDAQAARQDELLAHLSALPKVLETIPASNRLHGETLMAVHQQLIQQTTQQGTLGEILEKLNESGGHQKDLLEGLRERIETLNHQDKSMADSLTDVGTALESVSKNSSASTEVLGHLSDNLKARDTELEKVLHRQGARFTTMLAIAIFLSIAALAAVVIMGFLLMKQMH